MPNIKSAQKALKQNVKKRKSNLKTKNKMKGLAKDFNELAVKLEKSVEKITAGDIQEIQKCLQVAYQAIDKATKKGVIKKNTASRKKSKLAKKVNALQKSKK